VYFSSGCPGGDIRCILWSVRPRAGPQPAHCEVHVVTLRGPAAPGATPEVSRTPQCAFEPLLPCLKGLQGELVATLCRLSSSVPCNA